jgi:ketosteroid isomerase-like protein
MHRTLSTSASFLVAATLAVGAQAAVKTSQDDGVETRNVPATSGEGETRKAAAEDFARRFFAAYDAHDVKAAKTLLAPDMKVLGIDASERDVAALLKDIAAASASPAPKRELGNFEVVDAGALIVVAFDNRVTSQGAGEGSKSLRYRESWVLKSTPAGLRAVWATYALEGAEPDTRYQPGAEASPDDTKLSAQDQPAADFIKRFFAAYIGRRPDEMRSLFLPGSKFVFPDASESSIEPMAEHQTGPAPPQKYPRPDNGGQIVDHFEVLHVGPAMVVVFDNNVTDWRAGHPERVEHTFRESWILKETPGGLRDVWVAMSLYGNSAPRQTGEAKSH